MKFIVSSTALLKQLQGISGVLTTSSPLPILDNFLFEVMNGQLTISASDLETTMTTQLSVEAKDNGRIAIPAKILMETLKTFPEQPLTFTIDEKNNVVEISSDHGKYKLSGQPGEDFPRVSNVEGTTSVEIPSAVLLDAINKTIFATGNDELRPVMSGVYFQLSGDNVIFVSTDAHKLVRYTRKDAKSGASAAFIVPKKPLNLLKNVLPQDDSIVKMEYNESNAFFTFDSFNLICRLIDGRYPNYEAVIPKENPNQLTIDRQEFLNSIRRVSIFSNKTTHQVRLKIAGSEIQISAEDIDFANEANERLKCSYDGEDMEIGFNARFLVDMLNNLETDEVRLAMSAPNRAGLILPANGDAASEDLLMLVMPVMLNN